MSSSVKLTLLENSEKEVTGIGALNKVRILGLVTSAPVLLFNTFPFI